MATRRMRIKATINVPRGGIKTEPQEQPSTQVPPSAPLAETSVPSSPGAPVPSPRISSPAPTSQAVQPLDIPSSPGGGSFSRACTPPVSIPERIPSSPKSPSPASWQLLQRPSPSKSPAGLPPSGSILRRSPSPALSRVTNSPGPPSSNAVLYYPTSPVKSPVPTYTSPPSPVKVFSRTPVVVIPSSSVSLSGGGILRSADSVYPTSSASPVPHDTNVKSPVDYLFRPPPSPSLSNQDFHSIKSPSSIIATNSAGVSRPSPAQSPVYGFSRPPSNSSINFLTHHFNSNSNSADSHEVAALMGANTLASSPSGGLGSVYPLSPEKRPPSSSGRDSASSRSSHGTGQGAFSSVSSNVNPSPSFAKTMFENPESLKKRSDEIRKKEGAIPNPTKFATARKEFFDKLQSGQAPERNKLTMLHFTFYNPPNPDKSSKLSLAKRKSRSRASSVCSDASSIVKLENDVKNNDENTAAKANSAPSSIAGSRRTTASSVGSAGSCAVSDAGHSDAGSVASNASSGSMPGPRVKVGPDGQLILDEKSLVVETSESQRARQQIEDMEVVSGAEYAVGSSGFYRYKKNYRRGADWTERETIRFYRALNQCGTDFSMMLSLFPNRTRQELKAKFKREDRRNPDMISKVLASCIFDPDEGISSDEELSQIYAKGTEKERRLNEEKEMEEVICSSEDAQQDGNKKKKSKGLKKKREIEFTTVQMQEMKELASNTKGVGTGKGRKWNTPVEGLDSGKLVPLTKGKGAAPSSLFQPISKIKEENTSVVVGGEKEKPKKKYTRKKKQLPPFQDQVVDGSAGTTISAGPAPGTVSIIISSGIVSTPSAGQSAEVKKEKQDGPSSQTQEVAGGSQDTSGGSKRRSRLTKTKPNLKRGGPGKEVARETESTDNSSQSTANPVTDAQTEDLFRFDTSDALGMKVLPAPLPVVEETDLVGNEEGSEGLVIVDLDELNSIQKETDNSSTSTPQISPPPKKRKGNDTTDGTLPVVTTTTTRVLTGGVDPYGKSVMASTSLFVVPTVNAKDGDVGDASSQLPNKTVKVLPYRVPGPGGLLPSTTRRVSLADELEIEIEMSTAPTS